MRIHEVLHQVIKILKKTSSSSALDAEVLLSHILKKDKVYLYANPNERLTQAQELNFRNLIQKRRQRWPVAYLIGHKEFFGLDFQVTPDVLIPRPETELLVELALTKILPLKVKGRKRELLNIVDLGTGSGNIIISLAKKLTEYSRLVYYTTQFYAMESSSEALKIAKANASRHGVFNKIKFLKCDLLENCKLRIENSLIVANLPYGWNAWKNNSSTETKALKFEPQRALFTKEQGLYLIRRLLNQISKSEAQPKFILLEFDPRQKQKLQSLAKKHFPQAKINFHKDLVGFYRVLEIQPI